MTERETFAKGCGKATITGHGEYLLCGADGYGETYYCDKCLKTVLPALVELSRAVSAAYSAQRPAFMVFFVKHVMPYEEQKAKENGDI